MIFYTYHSGTRYSTNITLVHDILQQLSLWYQKKKKKCYIGVTKLKVQQLVEDVGEEDTVVVYTHCSRHRGDIGAGLSQSESKVVAEQSESQRFTTSRVTDPQITEKAATPPVTATICGRTVRKTLANCQVITRKKVKKGFCKFVNRDHKSLVVAHKLGNH